MVRDATMPWIDVASCRWDPELEIELILARDPMVAADFHDLSIACLRSRQAGRLAAHADAIHAGADRLFELRFPPKGCGRQSSDVDGWLVGCLILSSLLGRDRAEELEALQKLAPRAGARGKALLAALARSAAPRKRRARRKPISFDLSEPRLLRRIAELSTAEALDLCNAPRHGLTGCMRSFLLPLADALAAERGRDDRLEAFEEWLSDGAHPERRGELLFDRSERPPEEPNTEDPTDPSTWYPFSAVERKEGRLWAYWWLGFVRGKLVFDPSAYPNEFWMFEPERVERAWRLVRRRVGEDVWGGIDEDLRADRATYVLVADLTTVVDDDRERRRAAEAYGIDLAVRHLFDL